MTVAAWGLSYPDVIGLCWLAYSGQGTVGNWRFGSGSIWNLTTVSQPLNFRAVLVTSPTGKKILSFSGTDGGASPDWLDNIQQGLTGLNWQYSYARMLALRHQPDVVTGHSLGGGLASYTAIHNGMKAATINPAPVHLAGFMGGNLLPRLINHNKVINYVVRGEPLDLLDNLPSMARVGTIHYVSSNGADVVQKHLLMHLTAFVAPVKV